MMRKNRFEALVCSIRWGLALAMLVLALDALCPVEALAAGPDTQQAKLTPPDVGRINYFGHAVALSGDTAVVATHMQEDKGAVYVYVRTGSPGEPRWALQAKLAAYDGERDDHYGWSVAISGDTILVGAKYDDDVGFAAGSAYVYVREGETWTLQAKLTADDGRAADYFGQSVALSGDTALIGAHGVDGASRETGAAYVFVRNGATWTQQAKFAAARGSPWMGYGYAVALSGDTALVGVPGDYAGGSHSGAAFIYTRSGVAWTFRTKIFPADGAVEDSFGFSAALSGDTALIGAMRGDGKRGNSGSAYVFTGSGAAWAQQAKLVASDGTTDDYFGQSVALSGDTAIVGAYGDDNEKGENAGAAYVYTRSGNTWTSESKLTALDGEALDQLGAAVAISGDTALVGSILDDDRANDSGAAYVFVPSSGPPPTLNVRAFIDGRSHLVIQGHAVHWHHYDFAAPGRHFDAPGGNLPTTFNGVKWCPLWPGDPPLLFSNLCGPVNNEVRDCNCDSSSYEAISALAAEPQTVVLQVVQARHRAEIVQQPDAGNGYTLIVEFDDNPPGGAEWYEVNLTYQVAQPGPQTTIHVHTGQAPGQGQPGWLVRVYEPGGSGVEIASRTTDANGDANFGLAPGRYRYAVEGNGLVSGKRVLIAAQGDTVHHHRLSTLKVRVRTCTAPLQGYTVAIHREPGGQGGMWDAQVSDADGWTTFALPDGQSSFTVSKDCYTSAPKDVDLPYGAFRTLAHKVAAQATVRVGDNQGTFYSGYQVRVYNANGYRVGQRTTYGPGGATFELDPLGSYQYEVSKNGVTGARVSLGGEQLCTPVVEAEYKLAEVTVHVQDQGGQPLPEYLVWMYAYDKGQIAPIGRTLDDGDARFYLIEGRYQYLVRKDAYLSSRLPEEGFVVDAPLPGDDQTFVHIVD